MPRTVVQRVLAVEAAGDPVLHHLAPLGLAAAAGTALVVDLDDDSPTYPGPGLAGLAEEGLRREHLHPTRRGVAVVGHGGAGVDGASEIVEALARHWPAVVLRKGRKEVGFPTVPVRALLPGPLAPRPRGPAVYQRTWPGAPLPGPGFGLPPLGRGQVAAMLAGRVEPRWRWVRAWRPVWEAAWP